MTAEPWGARRPLEGARWAAVFRRAVFSCCKWDPQVGDESVLLSAPLVLQQAEWSRLRLTAEALFREALAAEAELLARPALLRRLGLPRRVRRAVARSARLGRSYGVARVMRFDFHHTTQGWRLSEVNADVPGGFVEASGFTALMAEHYSGLAVPGDPADAHAEAVAAGVGGRGVVALVHATCYADDRQVMEYLSRHLKSRGLEPRIVGPAHLRWERGAARFECDWCRGFADAVVRFFPAEWLPSLPRRWGWERFFHGGHTPQSNPAHALIVQSKRLPLVWDRLAAPMTMWRQVLPATVEPRSVALADGRWVLKPALGRVGEGVGMRGVTPERAWRRIVRQARLRPHVWVAQRRFDALPWRSPLGVFYPCIGVFVVDGVAAGVYGRVAARPLIDDRARDVAVLVEDSSAWVAAAAMGAM